MNKKGIFASTLLTILLASCMFSPTGNAIATSTCEDSDGGKNTMLYGYLTITVQGEQKPLAKDNCDEEVLFEYYCTKGQKKTIHINCTEIGMRCQDGACTPKPFWYFDTQQKEYPRLPQ